MDNSHEILKLKAEAYEKIVAAADLRKQAEAMEREINDLHERIVALEGQASDSDC